jgi:hypothetical protein
MNSVTGSINECVMNHGRVKILIDIKHKQYQPTCNNSYYSCKIARQVKILNEWPVHNISPKTD